MPLRAATGLLPALPLPFDEVAGLKVTPINGELVSARCQWLSNASCANRTVGVVPALEATSSRAAVSASTTVRTSLLGKAVERCRARHGDVIRTS